MTHDDVKSCLNQVRQWETQLAVDRLQMESAADDYARVLGVEFPAPEWERWQATLEQDAEEYVAAWDRATAMIALVEESKKQRLLILRYLQYMDREEVAEMMGNAVQHIDRMQRAALKEIARKMVD